MLVIDPASHATRQLTSPLLAGGNYFGGVLAPDGCLYLIPHQATHFIRIDPKKDEVTAFGEATGDIAYWGGVVGQNGRIYAIPAAADHVVEIDPATLECVRFGELSAAPYKFAGGVLAANGKIYCMPDQARQIMVIDPATRSINYVAADLGGDASKAYGGVLAANGKIYSGTTLNGRVFVLDPKTDEVCVIEDLPRDCYAGSVLGGDGRIYSLPNKPGEVLVIDPETDTGSLLPDSRITGGYWGSVLTPYGSIIVIPWEASRVLAIDFGSRLPADWPLSRLYNR
jgi:outer membrane protein assembly factor BamB